MMAKAGWTWALIAAAFGLAAAGWAAPGGQRDKTGTGGAVETKHWAYAPPVLRTPPAVKNRAWVRNPIDNFVLARLEKSGLKPSLEASKEILIRRVSLDLIGLPPTPQEVDAFLADRSPNAYEKVVDRLLASPRYGERWARPWLDLARYADSNGYEKDSPRSMWPYRDWVINALNKDMGFDEFTIEQIAGDLLPNATPDQKIATGFHRNTMQNEEGGVDQGEARWLTDVDRVGTTGAVWLGTTLACAQCHNHKYDPFTSKDFYAMFAFFEHTNEPVMEISTPELETKRKALQEEIAKLENESKAANLTVEQGKQNAARLADLKKQLGTLRGPTTLVFEEKKDGQIPSTYARVKGAYLSKGDLVTAATPAVLNAFPADQPKNRLGLARWLVAPDNPLTARVAVNRCWEQLFGRGIVETSEDFGTQGQRPTHPELLDWLACVYKQPENRSSAEIKTENAGLQGDEYLRKSATSADKLIGNSWACGWSMKSLLRLMVTSATYRQASQVTPEMRERDPFNRLLERGPRFRLEAEMIRDAGLAIGGLLSPKIGGPSVYPLQPDGIWDVPYSGAQWLTSSGEDRYRRGLYTFWRRSAPYPSFLTFDATSRESCTVRRIRTNTPLQALTTLNDPAYLDAARGLAERMQKEGGPDAASRIIYGVRLCLARRPRPTELARLTMLYAQECKHYQADTAAAQKLTGLPAATPAIVEKAAWTVVANVLLNLDETLTKE